MQRIIIFIMGVLLSVSLLFFAGCSNENGLNVIEAENSQPVQTPSETGSDAVTVIPTQTISPEQYVEYFIENNILYKQTTDEKTVLYNPALYNETYSECTLHDLITEDDTLFFIEWCGGEGHDERDYLHSILRLDKDGSTKKVLVSMQSPNGYQNLISFQNRLIFIIDGFDSVDIGDVSMDGSEHGLLDFSDYCTMYDAYPGFGNAEFYKDDEDYLYAELLLYCKDETMVYHKIRIDKDFNIERILPEQDDFYTGADKIYKTPANTEDKIIIYDASAYYADGNTYISTLLVTEDALYFAESGYKESLERSVSSIIKTNLDGGNRQLVYSSGFDTNIQPVIYNGKVFFAESSYMLHLERIGCVENGGAQIKYYDFNDYAEQNNIDASAINIWLKTDGDDLVAKIDFYFSDDKPKETRMFRIDIDLNVEEIG